MNQLSWLLYIGDVAGNLGGLFAAFSVFGFILGLILWIMFWTQVEPPTSTEPVISRPVAPLAATIFAIIFGIVACLAPSRDTVYAIAASQVGEQVIKSPVAGKAEKALEAWLDRQVTPPSKKDDGK